MLGRTLTSLSVADARRANNVLLKLQATAQQGLHFKQLSGPLEVVAVSDAAFRNLDDSGSQGGFLVMLCEQQKQEHTTVKRVKGTRMQSKKVRGCVLTWRSARIQRVVSSTFAAETLSALAAFDSAAAVRNLFQEITIGLPSRSDALSPLHPHQQLVPLHQKSDCFSLIGHIDSLRNAPREQRLKPDIAVFREAIKTGELTSLQHLPEYLNCSDGMTKTAPRLKVLLRAAMRGELTVPLDDSWTVTRRPEKG